MLEFVNILEILDFGFWIFSIHNQHSTIRNQTILDFRFWILDFFNPQSAFPNPQSYNFGFQP